MNGEVAVSNMMATSRQENKGGQQAMKGQSAISNMMTTSSDPKET